LVSTVEPIPHAHVRGLKSYNLSMY